MLSKIQDLFTSVSKLNIITLWIVFIILIVVMTFILFFFTLDFIGGLFIKPIFWLYKKISRI